MKIIYALWCENKKANIDKVWGAINLAEKKYVFFWGRRGGKLQVSKVRYTHIQDINQLAFEKMRSSGYKEYTGMLKEVYPGFEKDIEKIGIWMALKLD